jgi:nucleoside-diphosphate-sugar epimerase
MKTLIIGGTRNLGPSIVQALLASGNQVAVFNRGVTPDDLPASIERLRGDRSSAAQLRNALGAREFHLVVDTTLYNAKEAMATLEVLSGRCGRYIFLSSGQVYLVRVGLQRPFKESDYAGELMRRPPQHRESDVSNWLYGVEKCEVENCMAVAWTNNKFPYTSLRLPMVNSERDHYDRLYGYFLRLQDGGPIVIPDDRGLPVRHVYGEDVTQAIMRLAAPGDMGKGEAYNIGQDETLSLEEFLQLLARIAGHPLTLARVHRDRLNELGLLPGCSPFSDPWMSSLDNTRSKRELGMAYTPIENYLEKLVRHFEASPRREIAGYARRAEELELARLTLE